ncbi:uncharacterized protein EAE98_002719 [Botrytis deweyae]|uniref:Uncharacterized protein n=1 Tax=Botrytis deweyae TaxID=2478750 RepID=A0ABQ7IUK7_9HELO|nr:uncharacterized protein EAE98_002719 [Botrytis deweyae]KAF7934674.1 hypothetical protein EAE98_002719 [Botrytis deweyae]
MARSTDFVENFVLSVTTMLCRSRYQRIEYGGKIELILNQCEYIAKDRGELGILMPLFSSSLYSKHEIIDMGIQGIRRRHPRSPELCRIDYWKTHG